MANKIITQRITPHLWFAHEAEEAAKFYTSIFSNSSIGNITHYTEAGHDIHGMPAGSVLTIDFTLDGQHFIALNGGPYFKFNESVSFMIYCENQEEIDYYWEKLREGGDPKADQCGWLKDKFGLSWQVAPIQVNEMLLDKDKNRLSRVMNAIFKMKKLDLKTIEAAYNSQ